MECECDKSTSNRHFNNYVIVWWVLNRWSTRSYVKNKLPDWQGSLIYNRSNTWNGDYRYIYNALHEASKDFKYYLLVKRQTNLSASIAEPSSKSSSTIPTADSFFDSLLAESWDFFLNNRALSLFCFFGGVEGCTGLSGGIMSTTMQVVSSFRPLVLKASCRIIHQKQLERACHQRWPARRNSISEQVKSPLQLA